MNNTLSFSELKNQNKQLKQKIKKIQVQNRQYKKLEIENKDLMHTLQERLKELSCLYKLSDLVNREDNLYKILQGTTQILSESWQYPKNTWARIILADQEFKTDNFQDTKWKQISNLVVNNKKVGAVEVGYLEEKPECDEGPFLKEERKLIDSVSERLGRIVERKQAQNKLKEESKYINQLTEISPIAITKVDKNGKLVYANQEAEKLFGLTVQEIREKTFNHKEWNIKDFEGNPVPAAQLPFEIIKKTKKPVYNLNHSIQLPGQTIKYLSINSAPLLDKNGQFNGILSSIKNITKRINIQKKLKDSKKRIRNKLNAILSPEGDLEELELEDILDIPRIQALMDDFYKTTNIGVAIVDVNGQVLIKNGWQDICTQYHRQHPETNKNCLESDTVLSQGVPPGKFKKYKCKNNMWDIVTPIYIHDTHIGNIFLGQFLYEGEEPDYKTFRNMAKKYGFDEEEYLQALDRVPRWKKETVDNVMQFYAHLANLLADQSYSNLKLARTLEEKKRTQEQLQNAKNRYQKLLENSLVGIGLANEEGEILDSNEALTSIVGYSKKELRSMYLEEFYQDKEELEQIREKFSKNNMLINFETVINHKQGFPINILVNSSRIEINGEPIFQVAILDISKRKQAINRVKASEEKFRTLFNHSPAGIVLIDRNGNIKDYNKSIGQLNTEKDFMGSHFSELGIFTDDTHFNKFKEIKTGNLDPFELTLIGSTGHKIILEVYPAVIGKGSNQEFLFMALDITNRKKAAEKLRKLSAAVQQSSSMIAITDIDGDLEYINPKVTEITGYKSQEILGENPRILKSGELPKQAYKELWETIKSGQVWNGEFHNKKKNGKLYWEDANISPIFDANKEITNFVKVAHNITDKKEAQKALQESENKFRTLVEQAAEMLFLHDTDGQIIEVNQAAAKTTGYSQDELRNMSIYDIMPDAQERKAKEIYWDKLKPEGPPQTFETQHRRKDGSLYQAEVTLSKIVLSDGNYILSLSRDITERKQDEKEKEKLREQLLQTQKLKSIGTLAGGVAHDFNNILTVIIGLAQLSMSEMEQSDPNYDNLKEIDESAERAANLTRQLLLFSRKQDMDLKLIDLNQTILHLDQMLNRLIGEDIHLEHNFDDNLWDIKADETQIEQVLTNLVVNAQDAMPRGGRITINTENFIIDEPKAKTIPDVEPGDYVQLTVEDTGHGIPSEIQEKIFDPFFTTKGRAEGTGMGLSVVHGIIKEHNGFINVYSEPEQGTIFKIYLPRTVSDENPPISTSRSENYDYYRGDGETVLIVEDEKPVLSYLENILDNYGYKYYSVTNGEEALQIFKKHKDKIDLLLSDVIMTGIDGVELANKLKNSKQDLKVILSSGYSNKKVSKSRIKDKEYKFIQKPYDIMKLLRILYHTIQES
ncbi:MAG TPA: PAS domain S-box protein [bacterium]|nr:PAS domain S-box protein [bacterium]